MTLQDLIKKYNLKKRKNNGCLPFYTATKQTSKNTINYTLAKNDLCDNEYFIIIEYTSKTAKQQQYYKDLDLVVQFPKIKQVIKSYIVEV